MAQYHSIFFAWLCHLVAVVACFFMSREFAAFRLIFNNGNRNYILSVASNVSIASDDDHFQAHKWKWVTVLHTMKAFWYRFRHLIQKQAFWYRFRHLIQVQAFWYRFRHLLQIQALATDSGILIQIQAFWYRFRHSDTDTTSDTESCNLIQIHAIWYRIMQSAT